MSDKAQLLITGGRIVTPFELLEKSDILVENGRIRSILPAGSLHTNIPRVDAEQRLILPGLIDVHIQGAGGHDVLDGHEEALKTLSKTCARFGVTGFLATTVFRPEGTNRHLDLTSAWIGEDLGGADLLGIHLEGPFIAAGKRGMIQPDCIGPATEALLDRVLTHCRGGETLRMLTLAPEIPGALSLLPRIVGGGIIASLGHTLADYEQTRLGFNNGINHITHLYNAMPPIVHRAPGPIPALFEDDTITAQIIMDGIHIQPAVLSFTARLLSGRMVLITDGTQAMGLPDGDYVYNGIPYKASGGTARYLDGTLIGTALGLSQLVERCLSLTDIPLVDAVRAASLNPARLLRLDTERGSIEVGKRADLLFLDSDFTVWKTMKRGRFVYEA